MKIFRQFEGFRGLVLGKEEGKYRVGLETGEVVIVSEEDYSSSKELDISEVVESKLGYMIELFSYMRECKRLEAKYSVQKAHAEVVEQWGKVFIADQLLSGEEFSELVYKELVEKTKGEIEEKGYSVRFYEEEMPTVMISKPFNMSKNTVDRYNQIWESGKTFGQMLRDKPFKEGLMEDIREAEKGSIELNHCLDMSGVSVWGGTAPESESHTIENYFGIGVELRPLTRELAKEIAGQLVRKYGEQR